MNLRRSTALVATFVALAGLTGCAADSTLSSVNQGSDTAPPSAPTNIREERQGNVSLLAWDASPDADVVGYDIYQYSPDPARETAYVRLNASPIQAEEYSVSENAAVNAWYRVKAVDTSGNRSATSGAAWVTGVAVTGGAPDLGEEPGIRR